MRNFFILLGIILAGTLPTILIANAQPISLTAPIKQVREIVIYGGINDAVSNGVVEQIREYNSRGNEEITLKFISSPGGSVYAGLQIYDAMQESSAPIKTVCEGYCMSMAAILLTAGDSRETGETTTIMFHQLSMGLGGGKLDEVLNSVSEGVRLQKVIDDIISKHSGLTLNQVRELESIDRYLSPQQAKNLGLIDKVREYADK